jgi:hypothetical protein
MSDLTAAYKRKTKLNTTHEARKLQWKVHTTELLQEIASNFPGVSQIVIPLNIFQNLLAQVAQRATELHDPTLDRLMIRLTLYSIADPTSPDYDPQVVAKLLEASS